MKVKIILLAILASFIAPTIASASYDYLPTWKARQISEGVAAKDQALNNARSHALGACTHQTATRVRCNAEIYLVGSRHEKDCTFHVLVVLHGGQKGSGRLWAGTFGFDCQYRRGGNG